MKCSIVIVVLVALMQGCAAQQRQIFSLGNFLRVNALPYDSPTQIIYRIDDHRFVTLENYRDCNYGQAYYNDMRIGIKTGLGRASIEDYQGRLINADMTGKNLAFPSGAPPHLGTSDHGVDVGLLYSTDGGRNFSAMVYMKHSFDPFEDSRDYSVFVTGDRLYVSNRSADNDAYVVEYPMVPGIDLSKPYPPGVRGGSFAASKRPSVFSKLRTPSGQDRITCDTSIKPTNPDAPLIPQ
ncbi:hypothetical protein CFB89_20060 [Burkholderia sp. AU16741]|uniref:T6SS immunity protein Tli3 family protein n=1 Tax=unclassified Burkholderia TaxID=2613784 RepID=UPI000B7A7AC5|nr:MULTISPECIES: hypothetical protein [unclassified Burkholderia]MDN7428914.1 hypothetical protein [Burkholderia sp. AU45388]OXI31702.1 hypothetical protein CFB89_20060 [Burkholderia sp. AU16741]